MFVLARPGIAALGKLSISGDYQGSCLVVELRMCGTALHLLIRGEGGQTVGILPWEA